MGHNSTKLHWFLISSFRDFVQTDAQTADRHSWHVGKNNVNCKDSEYLWICSHTRICDVFMASHLSVLNLPLWDTSPCLHFSISFLNGKLRLSFFVVIIFTNTAFVHHSKLLIHTTHIKTEHYDLWKHFFSARIVNIWDSLPNSIVDACTISSFKARLDKFWQHQLLKFDFTASLTGTRNDQKKL